jgi:hypothetical protein
MALRNCREIPDGLDEIAVLLVSELVTNAYKAMLAESSPAPLASIFLCGCFVITC